MRPDNVDHITADQRPATPAELRLMQELGREVNLTIHAFIEKKKTGLTYGTIVGAFQYIAQLHGQRMQALSDDFSKLEAAVDHLKISLPEPLTKELQQAENPTGAAAGIGPANFLKK